MLLLEKSILNHPNYQDVKRVIELNLLTKKIINGLYKHYNVNPAYIRGESELMFIPQKREFEKISSSFGFLQSYRKERWGDF